MPNQQGYPCWTDLSSADPKGVERFYSALFGWTFSEPEEELGNYQRASKDGKDVAGLFPLMPGMTTSVWTVYLQTDDSAKTEQAISENGGTVISPSMEVRDLGTMLVASDPTGAVFGTWQAGTFGGAELVNSPGAFTWDDLRSHDPVKAREFYTSVFGYDHNDIPGGEAQYDYKTFHHAGDERPLGGMGAMMGAPEGTPSHWVAYFQVEDTPKAVEIVKAEGGNVLVDTMETPFGRQAMIADPFGGIFNIIDPPKWQQQ